MYVACMHKGACRPARRDAAARGRGRARLRPRRHLQTLPLGYRPGRGTDRGATAQLGAGGPGGASCGPGGHGVSRGTWPRPGGCGARRRRRGDGRRVGLARGAARPQRSRSEAAVLLLPQPASLVWPPTGLRSPCCALRRATLRTHAERAALRPPTAPRVEATHGACLDLKPYACVSTIRGVQHSGNDGRIELETLSAAELGEMVKRHESGVGPAIIHRLRQLQMGAKIREAQARRTAAQGTG